MKTLNTIQTLSKIGKILSVIIFVFCIVGFCFCVAGIICLAAGVEAFKLGEITVKSLIAEQAEASVPTLYAAMVVGLLYCAGEAVVCKFAEAYFKHELADGQPFTLRGAKEMLRLGILTIVIPLGVSILGSIGVAVAKNATEEVGKLSFSGYTSVGLGIALIITSLIFRYGAEQTGLKE